MREGRHCIPSVACDVRGLGGCPGAVQAGVELFMVALGMPYAFYCGQALASIRYDSFLQDTPVESLYMVNRSFEQFCKSCGVTAVISIKSALSAVEPYRCCCCSCCRRWS